MKDFTDIGDAAIVADLAAGVAAECRLHAHRSALLAEAERRGLSMQLGYSSIPRWWAASVRITDGSGRVQVEFAQWLVSHPAVWVALDTGEISSQHARAVADGLELVCAADVHGADENAIVTVLLETARTSTAPQVTKHAMAMSLTAAAAARKRFEQAEADNAAGQRSDAAGSDAAGSDETGSDIAESDAAGSGNAPPVTAADNADLNSLVWDLLSNGRMGFRGNVDALTAEVMRTAVSALAAPRPGPDGERDPRSSSKRNADALAHIIDSHGTGRTSQGRSRSNVVAFVDIEALNRRAATSIPDSRTDVVSGDSLRSSVQSTPSSSCAPRWPFALAYGGAVSAALAELISCDSNFTVAVVDGAGVPLTMGRMARLVNADLRTAVALRDRGCVMCGAPPSWCDAHHARHWADGGSTDLGNLALLCGPCHRQLHQQRWSIEFGVDGYPWVLPPMQVDASRTPRASYHRRVTPRTA